MSDLRNFAKVDLGYFDNPKISEFVDERPKVPLLHLRAILYCRQHLTDGTFPVRVVVRLACASHCGGQCPGECDYCAAVSAGLFTQVDSKTGLVHDYLEHQDSAEQANRRKAAGQKAAAARWSKNADRIADGNTEKRREEKRREEYVLPVPAAPQTGRKRAPEVPLPEDWTPTASHEAQAAEHRITLSDEVFKFRHHATANDRRQRNWNSAFSMWLSNAKSFGPKRPEPEVWRGLPPEPCSTCGAPHEVGHYDGCPVAS